MYEVVRFSDVASPRGKSTVGPADEQWQEPSEQTLSSLRIPIPRSEEECGRGLDGIVLRPRHPFIPSGERLGYPGTQGAASA